MYSTDPALQAGVEKSITHSGDYDALLVAFHGLSKADPAHPVVTFSGHYVTGSHTRGKTLGPLAITPICDSSGEWQPPAPSPTSKPQQKAPASAAASAPRAG
jgi:hypothetical protein